MRNKRQKSNWDGWENVKAAHAKILQKRKKENEGEVNGNKLIKNLLNILRQHFPGCAISKANCRSQRLIYGLSNWLTNWQTEWLTDWLTECLSHCEAALGLWWMFHKRHLPIVFMSHAFSLSYSHLSSLFMPSQRKYSKDNTPSFAIYYHLIYLLFLCIYFVKNHFISFCLASSWLHFDFQFRVWKIFTKEKLPFEQA